MNSSQSLMFDPGGDVQVVCVATYSGRVDHVISWGLFETPW